jgi:flagella synthesis protein FlgN
MTQQAAAANLSAQLHAERDALRTFVTLLETEQQALISGDTEPLLTLADSKIQAAQALNKLIGSRERNLLALGATSASGGLTAWLKTHAANILPLWQEIQQFAEQAQQLNRNNGILIQTKLRHNQQALSVLNNAANRAGSLYGPDGQHNISTSGRTLGSV